MSTRRRIPRPERERQMLEVARRLYAERGYAAVSMDAIAEAVGVTKPMLYNYFGSKEGLFAAATEHAAADLREAVARAGRSDVAPDERLWRGLLAVFDFVEENGPSWDLVYPSGPQGSGPFAPAAADARDAMAELLTDLFAETAAANGLPAEAVPETEPIAHAMTGATIATATWWRRHPHEPKELVALRLMNFAWQGLNTLMTGRVWVPPPADSLRLAERQGPDEFARRVLAFRGSFVEEVFRRMPERFVPEAAGDRRCAIEWRITGGDGPDERWQVHVAGGRCSVSRGAPDRPDVRMRVDVRDFVDLALGRVRGPELVLRGRLHIRGNLFLALRIQSWFRPAAPGG